jgi:hypothetical protein
VKCVALKRRVALGAPTLAAWSKASARAGKVRAKQSLHPSLALGTYDAVPSPLPEVLGCPPISRACVELKENKHQLATARTYLYAKISTLPGLQKTDQTLSKQVFSTSLSSNVGRQKHDRLSLVCDATAEVLLQLLLPQPEVDTI